MPEDTYAQKTLVPGDTCAHFSNETFVPTFYKEFTE